MKCFIRCLVAVSSLFVLLPAHSSLAQINVFVDWSGFELRLNEATAAAGVSSFSAAEVTTIKSNVFNDMPHPSSFFDSLEKSSFFTYRASMTIHGWKHLFEAFTKTINLISREFFHFL